ncbi:hypothetical protein D9M71_766900 [compost metagenome]
MNAEVQGAKQQDLTILEELANGRFHGGQRFTLALLLIDGTDQCVLLFTGHPLGIMRFGVKPEPDEKAQEYRGQAFDGEHPLPAVKTETFDLQQGTRQRT